MLMLCGMMTDDNVREDRRSGEREKRGNEALCSVVGGDVPALVDTLYCACF